MRRTWYFRKAKTWSELFQQVKDMEELEELKCEISCFFENLYPDQTDIYSNVISELENFKKI